MMIEGRNLFDLRQQPVVNLLNIRAGKRARLRERADRNAHDQHTDKN